MDALAHIPIVLGSRNFKSAHPKANTVAMNVGAATGLPWQATEYVKSVKIIVFFILSALILFFLSSAFVLKQRPKISQKKVKQMVSNYYYP